MQKAHIIDGRPDPTPRTVTKVFQYTPIGGKPAAVRLTGTSSRYAVATMDGRVLGELFRDPNPAYGWRWKRAGIDETRGGGLSSLDETASMLCRELRRLGVL